MTRIRFGRLSLAAAATCMITMAALSSGAPATADAGISGPAEATMRAIWDTYGVPPATQEDLLHDLKVGTKWDSLDGTSPASTEVHGIPGGEEAIERFPDGSIRVTSLQGASGQTLSRSSTSGGGVTPQASIDSCTTTSSTSYDLTRWCNVSTNVVVSNAAFTVTFHAVTGSNTQITSYSGLLTSCIVGTCSNARMVLDRGTQSGTAPASVTGWWTWTAVGGSGSKDFWLNFQVVGTAVSASNN